MKTKKLKIPIYGGKWRIVLCKDLKEVEKKYKLHSLKGNDAVYFDNKDCFVTAFNIKKVNNGTIAHECLHLVNGIFDYYGIIPDNINDEHQAYLLGWAVNQVHNFDYIANL